MSSCMFLNLCHDQFYDRQASAQLVGTAVAVLCTYQHVFSFCSALADPHYREQRARGKRLV